MEELPPALAALLQREFDPGERILWQARPSVFRRMGSSLKKSLFGVAFFAFAVFWTWSANTAADHLPPAGHAQPPALFSLWGGMFMLLGAIQMLTPLWTGWKALRTVYAITDRRAILIEAPLRRTIRSFAGVQLTGVIRRESWGGRGDIIFEYEAYKGGRGRTYFRDIGFLAIPDPRTVENLIRDAYASTQ